MMMTMMTGLFCFRHRTDQIWPKHLWRTWWQILFSNCGAIWLQGCQWGRCNTTIFGRLSVHFGLLPFCQDKGRWLKCQVPCCAPCELHLSAIVCGYHLIPWPMWLSGLWYSRSAWITSGVENGLFLVGSGQLPRHILEKIEGGIPPWMQACQ